MQSSSLKKSLGGYFELELGKSPEFHFSAIPLNTGRNALEYILRARKYSKIFLPYYICDSILEPVIKLNLQYEFYHIDEKFDPILQSIGFDNNSAILYVNYFGIKNSTVENITSHGNNLIIDNSQSFFSKPLSGIDTFYSARKFFGVPDGAYLYTNKQVDYNFENDISYNRFEHLLGRIDLTAEKFYESFLKHEQVLANQDIKSMSNITKRILMSLDYKNLTDVRKKNFYRLNHFLRKSNMLSHIIENIKDTPMVYPYLVENGKKLKEKLIANKIYVPTYWTDVKERVDQISWENYLTENLVAIPIHQNIEIEDLNFITKLILND